MAWLLLNNKTGGVEHGPGALPENWGPVFGVSGFIDDHGVSMAAVGMPDLEWVECEQPEPETVDISATVNALLAESDWSVLPDSEITVRERAEWVQYRRALRQIKRQRGGKINWPMKP